MVRTIDKDMFDGVPPRSVLLHQANCLGVAGGGVARLMHDKFKGWFESYAGHCMLYSPRELLGTFHVYDATPDLKICSVFGQNGIGKERRQTDYEAWKKALPDIVAQLESCRACGDVWTVYAPYGIGCGLGGGDWNVMKDLFEYYAGPSPVEFFFCRLPGVR